MKTKDLTFDRQVNAAHTRALMDIARGVPMREVLAELRATYRRLDDEYRGRVAEWMGEE